MNITIVRIKRIQDPCWYVLPSADVKCQYWYGEVLHHTIAEYIRKYIINADDDTKVRLTRVDSVTSEVQEYDLTLKEMEC